MEQADEVGPARLHVEQDHRLQAQVAQGHLGLAGEAVVLRQQGVGLLRRHQGFGGDGAVQVVVVEEGQVEGAGGEALHQLLLLAVADADVHPRIFLAEARDQLRQVERRDGFEAADIDLPGDYVVVGQGVLLELAGHPQQFLGLLVEAGAAGGQGHALGVVADEQLHAEAFFQALDGGGDGRLGDVELARGLGHAAGLDRRHEVLELSQGIGSHGHLCFSAADAWAGGAFFSSLWVAPYPRAGAYSPARCRVFSYDSSIFLIIFLCRKLAHHLPRPEKQHDRADGRLGVQRVRSRLLAAEGCPASIQRQGTDRWPPGGRRFRRDLRFHQPGHQPVAGPRRRLRRSGSGPGRTHRAPRLRRRPLGPHGTGGAQEGAAAPRRPDAATPGRAGPAGFPEHGQAGDGCVQHRRARRRPRLRLVRRGPGQAL
ncbi:hypothetical protein D9M68_619790 [compost metagenome]